MTADELKKEILDLYEVPITCPSCGKTTTLRESAWTQRGQIDFKKRLGALKCRLCKRAFVWKNKGSLKTPIIEMY